ncbi:hypothetical protein [Caballeronia sordidicola]|jgi:hypothetical protein|nr:hypothetical protein [Caballeronia sordidicola]
MSGNKCRAFIKTLSKLACAAGLIAGISSPADATNVLTFGTPGRPGGWSYQGFISDSLSGSIPTLSVFNMVSYYTPVGITGTTRDQFQFELRGAVGHTSLDGKGSPVSGSSPGFSLEYYYAIVPQNGPDKMAPGFFEMWTNPQIVINFPTGLTRTSGYGSGTDQYSFTLEDNNYIALGRFGISINPLTITYAARNMNATIVNGQLFQKTNGVSMTFMDTAVGYWVTPNLMLGAQAQYNVNNVYNSDNARTADARGGPAFIYTGFGKQGFYFAGNFSRDFYHTSNTQRATVVQLWVEKYF